MAAIQWFPGHMAKTNRKLAETLKLADIVIEVLDARIPASSGNPDMARITAEKRRLLVFNKEDLADPNVSQMWKAHFLKQGAAAVFTNARDGAGVSEIRRILRKIALEKAERQAERGVLTRPVRAIVAGVPNSGKSSLINRLAGRASAKAEDRPGVTRSQQWIRIGDGIELLDTPGILWPKFETEIVALHLALTGAIKDEIFDTAEVAEKLLQILCATYPGFLARRYGVLERDASAVDGEGAGAILLDAVGRRRGFLLKGGTIDYFRTSAVVLDEFRAAKIGRITLERPRDLEEGVNRDHGEKADWTGGAGDETVGGGAAGT